MSNIWETRHRLLIQQCEKLTHQLIGKEVPGQALTEEQAVRLLTGVVIGTATAQDEQTGPMQGLRRARPDLAVLAATATVHGI